MNQSQFLEFLKEVEDSIFNDAKSFTNAHCLSHGRIFKRFIVQLTQI